MVLNMRRVVITGIGAVSPIGLDVDQNWESLLAGKSGIEKISKFDVSQYKTKIAGTLKDNKGNKFNPDNYIDPRDQKKMDKFIQYGMAASAEAIRDSNWLPEDDYSKERTGVIVGSGIGGIETIENSSNTLKETGRVSPYFIPSCLVNLLSGNISIKYDYRGPNHSVVTACATGAHAIGDASRLIKYGDADVMIAGGSEAPITPLCLSGFSILKALAKNYNESPEKASRPWDKDREGFVMSEGSAILVLEEYEHAKKRGAKIYAEIVGYGLSGESYHITSTHPDGIGGLSAMKRALNDARIAPEQVGYINAHGTSTPVGDASELKAVQSLFIDKNPKIKMSSTKSMIGHLLGAAGSIEAIYTALALKEQKIPPTINLENPMDEAKIDLVPNNAIEHKFDYAISNSFGFGGTNTCLVFKKYN